MRFSVLFFFLSYDNAFIFQKVKVENSWQASGEFLEFIRKINKLRDGKIEQYAEEGIWKAESNIYQICPFYSYTLPIVKETNLSIF